MGFLYIFSSIHQFLSSSIYHNLILSLPLLGELEGASLSANRNGVKSLVKIRDISGLSDPFSPPQGEPEGAGISDYFNG
jgi:hypothetical protein